MPKVVQGQRSLCVAARALRRNLLSLEVWMGPACALYNILCHRWPQCVCVTAFSAAEGPSGAHTPCSWSPAPALVRLRRTGRGRVDRLEEHDDEAEGEQLTEGVAEGKHTRCLGSAPAGAVRRRGRATWADEAIVGAEVAARRGACVGAAAEAQRASRAAAATSVQAQPATWHARTDISSMGDTARKETCEVPPGFEVW